TPPAVVPLARDCAAVLAGVVGLVAPRGLDRELVAGEGDVLGLDPGALVGVLAALGVVPAILDGGEVVRIRDRFGVLVADDDAPAVEDAVAEGVAGRVDVVESAALAEARPLRVLPRDERILDAVWVAQAV